ncbi:MAG: hypothetical protein K2Y32_03535 [Candidatus Obscuribacterales bacterium]|nr:hypothetical protein [Candidatus Obscuribacterales bacterium]
MSDLLEPEIETTYQPAAAAVVLPSQALLMVMDKVRTTIILVGFFYSALGFLLAALALILLAPSAYWMINKSSPILLWVAQLGISGIALVFAIGCLVIGLSHKKLQAQLTEAETLIDNLRDRAFLQIQATRYNLEDLTERLTFPKESHSPSPLDYIDVAKKIGPLLSLWNAKERSLVTLGVEGLKFIQALKKILK